MSPGNGLSRAGPEADSLYAGCGRPGAVLDDRHLSDQDSAVFHSALYLDAPVGERRQLRQLLIVNAVDLGVRDQHELGAAPDAAERALAVVGVGPARMMAMSADAVADYTDRQHRRRAKPHADHSGADDRQYDQQRRVDRER